MMPYLYGLFTIANLFIAVCITVYAYLFLIKTQQQRDRRPWDFLFVSSILFLLFEVISLLTYFKIIEFVGMDISMVGKLFEFLYSGLVLLAFVSQHDLIMKSHLIFISKKEDPDGIKMVVEGKYKKDSGKPPKQ